MPKLPIEDAWMSMAIGLHIHRYFLEVKPRFLERRVNELYDSFCMVKGVRDIPSLSELRSRFPDGFLEHCFMERNAVEFSRLWNKWTFAVICTELACTDILLVDERDCIRRQGSYYVDISRIPSSAAVFDEADRARIDALLEAARLTFMIQLNVSVIMETHARSPEDRCGAAGFPRNLLGTCRIRTDDSVVMIVEELLAQAAANWVYCYVMSREDPAPPAERRWGSPWSGGYVDTIAFTSEVFSNCIRLFFCEEVTKNGRDLMTARDAAGCRGRAEYQRNMLAEVKDFVYAIEEHLSNPAREVQIRHNSMNVYDLIMSFYPDPRRFEKYRSGGGAGQAGTPKKTDNSLK